jgi:LDH2 family malate/lactate/ureidoglycolate dehydrogenase
MQIGDVALRQFCTELLEALGVPKPHAWLVSDSLVAANLRGVDSHGVQMLPVYVDQIEAGSVDPRAAGQPLTETGACLTYNGENGLGQVVADRCTEHAVRLAGPGGLSLVVARNSNHFGAAAYWARKLCRAGLIGIVMCNASPAVPPWQGKEPRVGTNPICIAIPGEGPQVWLLDMATTTVAMGKVYDASFRGEPTIPPGWAMDRDGNPTTDTQTALNGFMLPLGGYKGSGLALAVEILCASLSGGPMSTEVGSLRDGFVPLRISQMFLAIDPARFVGLAEFQERSARLVQMIKSAATAPAYDEVLVAGEPEWRSEQKRLREGIPVPARVWETLAGIAGRLGVSIPA